MDWAHYLDVYEKSTWTVHSDGSAAKSWGNLNMQDKYGICDCMCTDVVAALPESGNILLASWSHGCKLSALRGEHVNMVSDIWQKIDQTSQRLNQCTACKELTSAVCS
jgi:hypothetical protein